MTEYTHSPAITIVVTRCHECRRYYGYEKNDAARCPHCASAKIAELFNEQERLERSNRSLRGALTRKVGSK